MLSRSLLRLEKRLILALLTEVIGLALSYIRTVNLSRLLKISDLLLMSWKGCLAMCSNTGVTWLSASHAVFPMPKNCDVQSHPVKAWNIGSPLAFDSPRVEQIC